MITILFTCEGCGLVDHEVKVEARESPDDDVVQWMREVVIPAIATHHAMISPVCFAKEITNLKIPIDQQDTDNWIGKQTDCIPPKGKK